MESEAMAYIGAGAAILGPLGGVVVWVLKIQSNITASYSKLNDDTNSQYDKVKERFEARERELENKISKMSEQLSWLNSQMIILMAEVKRLDPESPILKAVTKEPAK